MQLAQNNQQVNIDASLQVINIFNINFTILLSNISLCAVYAIGSRHFILCPRSEIINKIIKFYLQQESNVIVVLLHGIKHI